MVNTRSDQNISGLKHFLGFLSAIYEFFTVTTIFFSHDNQYIKSILRNITVLELKESRFKRLLSIRLNVYSISSGSMTPRSHKFELLIQINPRNRS